MFAEPTRAGTRTGGVGRAVRVDKSQLSARSPKLDAWPRLLLASLAIGFVLVGAGNLDLGPSDARLGLAAGGTLGPLGQVCGSWAPELWPGKVAASRMAAIFEQGGRATPGSVLWPAALAAVTIGVVLARRVTELLGQRSGLWVAFCWFACLGVVDHSGETGLDFLSGLAVVAAIDRLLSHGSDWRGGCWGSLAFLTGGWPPFILILLAVIVIGRREASFSPKLIVPPLAAFLAWSIWAMTTASTEAWAAALAVPFTMKPDWSLALSVLVLGLPFSPFVLVSFSRRIRDSWGEGTHRTVAGWLQTAIACLIAGTIVPGLSQAARVPALAGCVLLAALALHAAWTQPLTGWPRRAFVGILGGLLSAWFVVLLYGSYLSILLFPFYRPVGLVAAGLGIAAVIFGWMAIGTSRLRRGPVALVLLAISLKVMHWGYYVPEWNYRYGQGPWGRAIGQWLLPNWTLYTFHDWAPELAFAIGRPVHQLPSPQHLAYPATGQSRHVLLLESEFENWPEDAPHLTKIATLHDQFGGRRILARSPGFLLTPTGPLRTGAFSP